jgi:hypothetical protein
MPSNLTTPARVTLVGVVLLIAAAAATWWYLRVPPEPEPAIDLVDRFPEAEKRTTRPALQEAFAVEDVTIDGHRRRAILAVPYSRIIWSIEVPPHAVLKTAAALRPDAWDASGDGAGFRVGISDGSAYTEVFKRRLVPNIEPTDRHWIPIEADLAPWAGRTVDVIFNTDPGPGDNAVHDAAIWGAPRIVTREN